MGGHQHQTVGVRIGQRAQQDAVDVAEDSGVGTDDGAQAQHGAQGERRPSTKRSDGVGEIARSSSGQCTAPPTPSMYTTLAAGRFNRRLHPIRPDVRRGTCRCRRRATGSRLNAVLLGRGSYCESRKKFETPSPPRNPKLAVATEVRMPIPIASRSWAINHKPAPIVTITTASTAMMTGLSIPT